jgi:hypothetical protein
LAINCVEKYQDLRVFSPDNRRPGPIKTPLSNHEHLSIVGCYSTFQEANRRAKVEARRLQEEGSRPGRGKRRPELDQNETRGAYTGWA